MKPTRTKKELEHTGEKVIDWCVDKFGLSKYHEYDPWLDFDDDDLKMMGEYNIDENWPVGEESRGRSLRLYSPELDNNESSSWSLSPKTENSEWLYEGSDRINFGSPREENAFKLEDIGYTDVWFDINIAHGDTHVIYGDYNNYYTACL